MILIVIKISGKFYFAVVPFFVIIWLQSFAYDMVVQLLTHVETFVATLC